MTKEPTPEVKPLTHSEWWQWVTANGRRKSRGEDLILKEDSLDSTKDRKGER